MATFKHKNAIIIQSRGTFSLFTKQSILVNLQNFPSLRFRSKLFLLLSKTYFLKMRKDYNYFQSGMSQKGFAYIRLDSLSIKFW